MACLVCGWSWGIYIPRMWVRVVEVVPRVMCARYHAVALVISIFVCVVAYLLWVSIMTPAAPWVGLELPLGWGMLLWCRWS